MCVMDVFLRSISLKETYNPSCRSLLLGRNDNDSRLALCNVTKILSELGYSFFFILSFGPDCYLEIWREMFEPETLSIVGSAHVIPLAFHVLGFRASCIVLVSLLTGEGRGRGGGFAFARTYCNEASWRRIH